MNDIDEVKAKISATEAEISATKADLASAKSENDREMMMIYDNKLTADKNNLTMYGNNLTELQKEKNILLAGSGDLLSYWRSISMS